MKTLLSLILFGLSNFVLQSQILDPSKEWFEMESFFNPEVIKSKGISAIHISIQEKKDGGLIKKANQFLHYEFNADFLLKKSYKSIPLKGGHDTSWTTFHYNKQNRLIKKSEKNGPFHFTYLYEYENGLAAKEVKINENAENKDTVYERLLKSEKHDSTLIIESLNEHGKAYKTLKITYNQNGKVVKERINYSRAQNYTEVVYTYENNRLIQSKKTSYFHKTKEQKKAFKYNKDKIEFVLFYKNGVLIKKLGFTYQPNGLVAAVVERNYEEKSIRIFQFLYDLQKQWKLLSLYFNLNVSIQQNI